MNIEWTGNPPFLMSYDIVVYAIRLDSLQRRSICSRNMYQPVLEHVLTNVAFEECISVRTLRELKHLCLDEIAGQVVATWVKGDQSIMYKPCEHERIHSTTLNLKPHAKYAAYVRDLVLDSSVELMFRHSRIVLKPSVHYHSNGRSSSCARSMCQCRLISVP
jgi:hypothetical protein